MKTNDTLNALLVDDDYSNNELLRVFLAKYCPSVFVIGTAESVDEALEAIQQVKPDLLFLDIELHGRTAKDILEVIDTNRIMVILLTAYEKYAIEMYKYNIIHYLLKPLEITQLISAVNKASKLFASIQKPDKQTEDQELDKFIALPDKEYLNIVKMDDIIRLEASSNYTNIKLNTGKTILSSRTLKEYEDALPKNIFLRVHHSHIVNLKYVTKYLRTKNGSLVFEDGSEIPISANRKKVLTERIIF